MKILLARHLAPQHLGGWGNHAQAMARACVLLLSCGLLVHAGTLALPTVGLWSGLALPAGVGLAAVLRWGWPMVLPAALGSAIGLLLLEVPVAAAMAAVAASTAAQLLAAWCLRNRAFDPRLDRPRDLGWLATCTLLVMAPVGATLTWAAGTSPSSAFDAPAAGMMWLVGCFWIGTGGLATSFFVLTLDRRTLYPLQPSVPWLEPLVALLSVFGLWLALAWLSGLPAARQTLPFLPWLVVPILALRGHAALSSGAVIGALLLLAAAAAGPDGLHATDPSALGLGAWMASSLTLVIGMHAALVHWRGRSKRWEWALDASRLGVADWRADNAEAFASVAWRTLSNHGQPDWRPEDWVRNTHPEDRPTLEAAMLSLADGQAGRQQFELRLPDGEGWRWVETTLLVIERAGDGHPTRFLATLADVQERREALERKRMSASLFQHLHEGLLITDADQRALDVNPAYTQILGVTREELLGTVPSLLRPTPADPIARQQRAAMWASLSETGSWRGELIERRRNGEQCTLHATISTVPGPTRDLRYHVLVISDITEQRVQREQLERQAHTDELTRLPNRARLSQLLDDAMKAADRDGYLLAVCYLDLDRFKPVNDRYGHAAGDRLLAELAGRLRSALRSREHWVDSAARLGGDEFVLLLRAGTLEEARLAVERVLRVVSLPYVVDPDVDPVQVTASMGATIYPIDRSDADTLLRHADHAMYGAKQQGRNGYLFFDPEHRRRTEARVMAIGRVQEALDQSEFVLHYQPKVDMRSGRVHGFEALLRWDHPQQGLIAPLQFLPLIEHTGLSSRVGDWVLAQALEHLSQWRRGGLDINVSVNISARHLQEPDFAQRLSELLARHQEPLAAHLELEMLETAAHADIEATSALVARCQGIGVRFALDDFGTGYSTLTYLKRLPVDVLKIDRSFVHHMLDDSQDRAIVEGVIGLAGTFGCVVVAEGVESPAQARALLDMGCEIGQGTGIAAPMPADQVGAWVRDYRGMFALVSTEAAVSAPSMLQPGR